MIAVVVAGAVIVFSESPEIGQDGPGPEPRPEPGPGPEPGPEPTSITYEIIIISSVGGNTTGGGWFLEGSTATTTATPSEGYSFVGWYEGTQLYSDNSALNITVDSSHTLTPKFEKKTYVITVSSNCSSAGMVSGGGTVQHGDKVTLYASVEPGYHFSGWYEGAVFLSSNTTYNHIATKTTMITATYSIIHDASFTFSQTSSAVPTTISATSTYNVEISYRTWSITDAISGKTVSAQSSYGNGSNNISVAVSEGKALNVTQTVTYSDGQQATSSFVKVVDEKVTKHFSWRYHKSSWYSAVTNLLHINNGSTTWDVPVYFSWYYDALTSTLPRESGYSCIGAYVTYSDPTIMSMAQSLMAFTSGMSSIDRVNFVLKFVQSIPYQYDIDGKGVEDYWKLPAETIWEGKGDCEDHAFLFASLVKAMGYGVVLYYIYCYENGNLVGAHLATGVDVPGGGGSYTTVDGVRYYYCEATATSSAGWLDKADVGYQPSGYVINRTYAV